MDSSQFQVSSMAEEVVWGVIVLYSDSLYPPSTTSLSLVL